MKKNRSIILFFSLSILVLGISDDAQAYPQYALLSGDANCSGCHVNPTGGEIRNDDGLAFAMSQLPTWQQNSKFSGKIGDNIRIGMDFRAQYISYTDQIVAPFDSAGHTGTNKQTILSTIQAMSMPVYLAAQLTQSIVLFGRYDLLYGSNSRAPAAEAWGLWHFVDHSDDSVETAHTFTDAYVKAGEFEPAFGIRFDDHTIYTRNGDAELSTPIIPTTGLFWIPEYTDVGVELGTTLFNHIGITAGYFDGLQSPGNLNVDPSNNMALVLRGVYATQIIPNKLSIEIGGSYYTHSNSDNGPTVTTSMEAVHGGIRIGPVTIMSEADFTKNLIFSNVNYNKANAFACEGDVQVCKGFTMYARFDNYSASDSAGVSQVNVSGRYSVGFDWFPVRFVEIRPEFRIAKVTAPDSQYPTPSDQHTETTAFLQTHLFF